MNDFFLIMWKPFAACLILTGIHAYLGLHVIRREIIFVDLSLAQIAALGAAIAVLFEWELHSREAYAFSLAAACLGAVLLTWTRTERRNVPQEAVIGIIYVVSAALAVLIMARGPEGDEQIRHMLVGNVLLVRTRDLVEMAVLYGVIGLLHWSFREPVNLISRNPGEATGKGLSVKKWDLFFYLTFAVVVTSSVKIAGVLLVFSFLIIPAVAASLLSAHPGPRLFLAWLFGLVMSCAGMALSYFLDLPTGAAVVCVFGAGLLAVFCSKPAK